MEGSIRQHSFAAFKSVVSKPNSSLSDARLALSERLLNVDGSADPVLSGSQGEVHHWDLHGTDGELLSSLELLADLHNMHEETRIHKGECKSAEELNKHFRCDLEPMMGSHSPLRTFPRGPRDRC